jgi:thiol-disulfide isomerase/thioredoxin
MVIRNCLLIVGLLLMVALLLGAASSDSKHIETLPESRGGQDRIGDTWPELTFDGWSNLKKDGAVETNDRVTLYRWWTDTCPYCEASLPAFETLRKKYGERGLQVVAVYHPKPPREIDTEQITAMAKRFGYDGPIALDQDWSELRKAYEHLRGRRATSASFLVDAEGVIRFVHPGPMLFPSDDPEHAQQNRDYRLLERAVAAIVDEADGEAETDE